MKQNRNVQKRQQHPQRQPQNQIIAASQSQALQYTRSGPLPSAEELIKYNEAHPDAADRIIKMAECQHSHRIDLENRYVDKQIIESNRGQIFGFILGVLGLICGTICILMGKEIGGSVIGGGSLIGLVSVFVIGKKKQEKDLESKNVDE